MVVIIVQSLSCVQLFVTTRTAAWQTSLSFTISWSLLKLMSIEFMMTSNHLILCLSPSSPSALNLSQHHGLFQWVGTSHQVAKLWSFSISPSYEYSGLISSRIDWFDLLAVQGTLRSLLQHHNSKASILWCSVFFMVQHSHPYMTTGNIIALTIWNFVDKVMSLLFNMLSSFVIAFFPMSKHLLFRGCSHHPQWFWSPRK